LEKRQSSRKEKKVGIEHVQVVVKEIALLSPPPPRSARASRDR